MSMVLALLAAAAVILDGHQDVGHPLADALAGEWSGTLEYRDYRSDGRVTLPTKLTVVSDAVNILRFDYTYDEGAGRTVASTDRITISPVPATYRVQSGDGKYDTTFAVDGLADVRNGTGTVALHGRGRENDQDVELRITISVTPASLTMRRESRRSDEAWRFRNQYSFTRKR